MTTQLTMKWQKISLSSDATAVAAIESLFNR